MDRLRRWLSRRPTSRADVRRARVTTLVLLAVTAALAVLLAVLSHQAWPPVLVSILGTLPALYVAWLTVPGVTSPPEPAKKLAHGRPAAQWNPVDLGVHQVIGGGPMPTYIHRPRARQGRGANPRARPRRRRGGPAAPASPRPGRVRGIVAHAGPGGRLCRAERGTTCTLRTRCLAHAPQVADVVVGRARSAG
jgi:hypothetical protein